MQTDRHIHRPSEAATGCRLSLPAPIYGGQGRQACGMEAYLCRKEKSEISTMKSWIRRTSAAASACRRRLRFTVFHPAPQGMSFLVSPRCFQHLTVLERRLMRPDFVPRDFP